MSRAQKIFLAILSLYVVFDFILGSLVSLFLWEQTQSIRVILSYHLSLFVSIIIFTQLGSKQLSKVTPNKLYSASILLGSLQALLLYVLQNSISSFITLFGFLSGAVIGFQAISAGHITQGVQAGDSLRFISYKSSLTKLVTILTVPLLTYHITTSGTYTFSYLLGVGISVVLIFLARYLPASTIQTEYRLSAALKELWVLSEFRNFLFSRFLYGIFNGPIWAVLGIVTLL